jgi:DNA-binding YbaB/EbfC family protein
MDIRKMMQQAQQMQEKLQSEIAEIKIEASSGGGMVTAVVSGTKELISLRLEPDVVNPSDIEMLQDMIVAAVNEASRRVDEEIQKRVGGMAGAMGLKLPGM